jgi:autotransporter-associated beta strand protein
METVAHKQDSLTGIISGGNNNTTWSFINTSLTPNTIVLTTTNSYSGRTSIGSRVTLALSGTDTISASNPSFTDTTSIFDISATTNGYTLNNLATTTGRIALGTKNLALDNTINTSVASIISGLGGSISKQNIGVQSLVAINTYTGRTTIYSGTLALTGVGSIAASSGVTFESMGSNVIPTFFDISGIAGFSTTIGDLIDTIGGGTVSLGLKNLIFGTSADQLFEGVIQDGGITSGTGGSITKQGIGKQTLTAIQTYTGITNIQAGTLALTFSSSIADSAGALLSTGGVFDIAGGNQTIKDLSGTGGIVNLGVNKLTFGTANSTTYNGIFQGLSNPSNPSASLTKQGTGVVTLTTASNDYSGQSMLDAGGIILQHTRALGTGPIAIANNTGLTLDFSNTAFSNIIFITYCLIKRKISRKN